VDAVFIDDVPSPCIRVCLMHEPTGYCTGCLRSMQEIGAWSGFSRTEKLAVIARLEVRRAQSSCLADDRLP
jgi:predicted Fe-S protein YdhL (DUF1289 family)